MIPPTFVVGTGRCGSTMISSILREHPALLSLSELFSLITDMGTRVSAAFPEGLIDGAQFWSILSTPYPKQDMLIKHTLVPLTSRKSRFTRETGMPAIMPVALPHLTKDVDPLYAEVEAFVLSQPPAPIQECYLRLFLWLQQYFNRQAWVERSGGSLRFTHYFHRTFPDARFVHIVRDGRNVAISMSKNHAFRMVQVTAQFVEKLGVDPYESQDRSRIGELSDELRHLLPEYFDATAFQNYDLPLSLFGQHWSNEIIAGLHMLEEVPAERVLTLRYEDFLQEPEASIKKLIAFIHPDFVDEDWIRKVTQRVQSERSSWSTLPSPERELLNEACLPGFAALKSHRILWE